MLFRSTRATSVVRCTPGSPSRKRWGMTRGIIMRAFAYPNSVDGTLFRNAFVCGILSCMTTPTISIPVDDSIADAFRAASVERQRQLQILLGLRLRELTIRPQRSLDEILDQVGRAAESKGLTPKLLDSMLGDS